MDSDPGEVLIRPSPSGDAYLVEWRSPDTGLTTRFHVGRCDDRMHWMIYDPKGIPLARSQQLERALEYAVHLAQAEVGLALEPHYVAS